MFKSKILNEDSLLFVNKIDQSVSRKNEIRELYIDKTCRICLQMQEDDNLYSLYGTNEYFSSTSISTAINDCFGVMLHKEDNLPSFICYRCALSALQACTFKSTMLNSEHLLSAREAEVQHLDNKDEMLQKSETFNDVDQNRLSISFDHSYSLGVAKADVTEKEELLTLNTVLNDNSLENTQSVIDEDQKQTPTDMDNVTSLAAEEDVKKHYDTAEKWWLMSAGPPYTCKICKHTFKYRNSFFTHVRIHFVQQSICILCGEQCEDGKLKVHVCTQSNEYFICPYCCIPFKAADHLNKHLLSHGDVNLLLCEICGKGFHDDGALETHKESHGIGYICEYCGKTFMGLQDYNTHNQKFHSNVVPVSKRHKCDHCKKVFSNSKSLIQHYRSHNDKHDESLKCKICGLTFVLSFSYDVHMFLHKVQMSTFNSISFNCEFCFDMFTNKEAFEEHLRNHIAKPYQCNECNKFFSSKMKLKQHLIHHSDDRPYNCEYCAKKFKNPTTLYQHKKIHIGKRPYVCKTCNRSFVQQQQLSSHMFTHTGEKKYVCQYCGKAFALNGNLTVHVRRHTGETPFHCDICGKGFYDSSTLRKHTVWKH